MALLSSAMSEFLDRVFRRIGFKMGQNSDELPVEEIQDAVMNAPRIGSGAGYSVDLDNFVPKLYILPPPEKGGKARAVRIATTVEINDGQKVVVGRANVDGADSALIVVLAAKVVE